MCWENWKHNITQNQDRLEQYYTFINTPNGEYWDFNFSNSRFGRRYFIQVHRQVDVPPHEQPDCIYVYFRTEGQTQNERIALRNLIINNLRQLIERNGWSFSLKGEGRRLGDGNIKYRIENEDSTPIDDYQKMIDIMILIADNLQAIEAGEAIVTDRGKTNTDECPSANVKKNVPEKEGGKQGPESRRQPDETLFRTGVSIEKFNKFCDTFKITVPKYENGKITGDVTMAVPNFASWAVWDDPNEPNDNTNLPIGDLFTYRLQNTLEELQPNIVFVAENISEILDNDSWINFHRDNDRGNRNFRYVLNHSCFRGAYLTDFIKGYNSPNGQTVENHFTEDSAELKIHADNFRNEMSYLKELMQEGQPVLIVFVGDSAKKLFKKADKKADIISDLDRTFGKNGYFIGKCYHYSCRNPQTYKDIRCTDDYLLPAYKMHMEELKEVFLSCRERGEKILPNLHSIEYYFHKLVDETR